MVVLGFDLEHWSDVDELVVVFVFQMIWN